MGRGGARNRSGPQPEVTSGRSDRRGFTLSALPSDGYRGEAPEFPLPPLTVYWEYFEDKRKVREVDEAATNARQERELELWRWAWTTPQACAWSLQPWRWQAVAMWVRTSALCESAESTAADKNSLHRFADQIGLTPAGLKENGWAIADEQTNTPGEPEEPVDDPRARLTVVTNGAAG